MTLDFCRLPAADARIYIRTRPGTSTTAVHSAVCTYQYHVICGMYVVQQYDTAFVLLQFVSYEFSTGSSVLYMLRVCLFRYYKYVPGVCESAAV